MEESGPTWIEIITHFCIILCFITTLFQLVVHLRNFTNPVYQLKILVILQMPPIYILFSSLTIWYNDEDGYFLLIRNIYESFVIYAFFNLLVAYVGYEPDKPLEEDIEKKVCTILSEKGPHHHQWPFNYCLKEMNLVNIEEATKYYKISKYGILQYIPTKIILAVLMLIVKYNNGSTSFLCNVSAAAEFVSVCFALYWLVFIFHIFYEDLEPFRPLRKFLIIKGILFLTFWQEELLSLCGVYLANAKYIPEKNRTDADEILSCLLVDIEMVIMSILTTFAFSYKDFYIGKENKKRKMKDIINVKLFAIKMKGKIKKKMKDGKNKTEVENVDEESNIEMKEVLLNENNEST